MKVIKIKSRTLIIYGIITFLLGLLISFGVTYSYFTVQITGNDEAELISVGTAGLELIYTNLLPITTINALPGWYETQVLTVYNKSTIPVTYNITMTNVINTFVTQDDLVYEIFGDYNKSETIVPDKTRDLMSDISIDPGQTHEYIFKITFKNMPYEQDENQGSSFSGKIIITIEPTENIIVDIDENMIPIMYYEGSWVKADTIDNQGMYEWYNYDNFKWANAVLVSDTNRGSYKSSPPGTVIEEEDILGYFVYIPRYRYKLFNVDYNGVPEQMIEVEFETRDTPKATGYLNGSWLTHPAFTFGESELNGLWVGKFETSADPASTCYTSIAGVEATNISYCNNTSVTPRVLPNKDSWRYISVSTAFTVARDLKSNSMYGINTSSIDSHMMKNMEWGAVAYLSQSKYGKQGNDDYSGVDKEIYINNYASNTTHAHPFKTMTGCSKGTPGTGASVVSNVSTICPYTYEVPLSGTGASTTGTIYGIYDTSGGAWDYVMGNMSPNGALGTITTLTSGFNGSTVPYPENKYIDYYEYGTTNTDVSAHRRGKTGDATRETLKVFGGGVDSGWYGDYSDLLEPTKVWVVRGGNPFNGKLAGAVAFGHYTGVSYYEISFRLVLSVE